VTRHPVDQVLDLYRRGFFPMDDPAEPELPFYAVAERTVFELDAASRERTRRRVRRSLRVGERAGWRLVWDVDFEHVLARCAAPRHPGDGVWITPRLAAVYRALHRAGHAHSAEIRTADGAPAAGMVCVLLGRAAMLESMEHEVPHAGNCLVSRLLDDLAARGFELCDIQLPTGHTTALGAVQVPREAYEARLAAALTPAGEDPANHA
jgi:leucyl/phenylalanyl-tRNA---protein transferase